MPEEDQSIVKSDAEPISDAAVLPRSTSPVSAAPRPFFARLLETIYAALFTPTAAFRHLKDNPFMSGSVVVIILVNLLEAIRLQLDAHYLFVGVVAGLSGWLVLTLLLSRLAWAFGKEISWDSLLSVVAFASLPWLFIAPALSVGTAIGGVLAIAVVIWFLVWQFKGAAVVLETSVWRVATLVPLAIAGGSVAIVWLINFFHFLFTLSTSA
jgi:hypothetical protein